MKHHSKYHSNSCTIPWRYHLLQMTMLVLLLFLLIIPSLVCAAVVEWSQPLVAMRPRQVIPDEMINPYLQQTETTGRAANSCYSGVHLEWTTRVGSSVFATPRIVDLSHDGNKEILVPTYTQYLEALDGANGEDVAGFPFVHPNFKSYASPLPVDMDGDGKTEWLIAMYTGELMIFGDDGKARGAVQVPSLPIKKNWMKMNLNPEDAVSFKVKNLKKSEEWIQQVLRARRMFDMTPRYGPGGRNNSNFDNKYNKDFTTQKGTGPRTAETTFKEEEVPPEPRRRLAEINEVNNNNGAAAAADDDDDDDNDHDRPRIEHLDKLNDDGDEIDDLDDLFDDPEAVDDNVEKVHEIGTDGWLSKEAKASMDLLYHPELYKSSINYEGEKDAFNFRNMRNPSTVVVGDDEIAVDPHIMSTPVITDVDGDGDLDLILHLSYFFDLTAYEDQRSELLPSDIKPDEYVADALMVLNLVTGEVKWLKVLHLTTKNDSRPAFALSSPVVVNPDEDLQQDIFVTTTAGAIFGFTGRGKQLKGWPIWMDNPITASPAIEDVDGDGILDICVGDAGGNVACYSAKGNRLWKKAFSGSITDHITFGDVNGDGKMDLTFGTASGLLYALQGSDGEPLPHFPISTDGPILAPTLLVNLNITSSIKNFNDEGLHLVVPSHDGVLYIVSGTTGCMDSIDINEKSSSMVLADDMTGNGNLDLIVSTLSGSVMVFETPAKFHPLKAWVSRVKSTNGFTASEGHIGVFIHPSSRAARDIRGDTFTLLVTIYDKRTIESLNRWYGLSITVGPRVLVHRKIYKAPGTYAITMRAPLERIYASVSVVMQLSNGQKYEDSVALSFNMHFLESIKFAFLIPFLVACLAISFVSRRHEVEPPPFEPLYY